MEFSKYNGAGNDFIVISNRDLSIPSSLYPQIVRILCERRYSIGADGLMFLEPSDRADFRMRYFNSNGSRAEMCGNGLRCVCRYAFEHGMSGVLQRIEIDAGVVVGERLTEEDYRVQLPDPTLVQLSFPLLIRKRNYECSYVELGTPPLPHAVLPIQGLREYDLASLRTLARTIRSYPDFPHGANVNFYEIEPDGVVFERTYERGVEDFTYACGSGTVATALVLNIKGLIPDDNVTIETVGGTLTVELEKEGVYLTGPTNHIASGQVFDRRLTELLAAQ